MTFNYNRNKKFPRPECQLFISNKWSNIPIKIQAFADTGSDITFIPNSVISQMNYLIEGESIGCRGIHDIKEIPT
jgi:hypothetical protein